VSKKDNKPPDSAIKKASMYPGLTKPVDTAISNAQRLYKNGLEQAPFNDLQTGAIGGLQGLINNLPNTFGGATNYAANVGSGAGVGAAPGQSFLEGVYGNPSGNPAQGTLNGLMQRAAGGSGGLANIAATAGGAMLGGNPYVNQQIASTNADITRDFTGAVMPGIQGRVSQAGIAGSPMEGWQTDDAQRNLADRIAANTTSIRMGDYNNERGYQNQAQLALPGAFATDIGTATGAAGAAGGNYLQDLNQRIGAAGAAGQGYRSDVNTALGAGAQLGGMVQGQANPLIQGYGVGQQYQQAQQQQMNPQWAQLQQYIQMLSGIGGIANPQAAATQMAGYQSGGQQQFGNLLSLGGLVSKAFN
jgi:hypothetical protein